MATKPADRPSAPVDSVALFRQGDPIARAAHSLDHVLAVDLRERLTKALDVDVDGALVDEDVVAPNTIQ